MTTNTNNSTAAHEEHVASLAADLHAVHRDLDRDGAVRANEPDADFERRVAVGSFGGLMRGASDAQAPIAGRIGNLGNARRLAAAIAIVATAGATWMAFTRPAVDRELFSEPAIVADSGDSLAHGGPAGVATKETPDDWIAIATSVEDSTGAEIDSLFADTLRAEANLRGGDALLGGNISMDGGGV